MTSCGSANDGGTGESCCTSLEVTGGMFYRTYPIPLRSTPLANPATVSSFRLDKYLVTVGRFRQFVAARDGGKGWSPPAGSGKHTHLNGGQGLSNSVAAATFETGWLASDNHSVLTDTTVLVAPSSLPFGTWTDTAGDNENLPINDVSWYDAYAFCIWDGGFLPSDAELEYAAAGGSEQRPYPWGSTDPGSECPGTGCAYAIYNCNYPSNPANGYAACTGVANIAPVGTATLGAGRWGQLDLAGEVFEWTLDVEGDLSNGPCADCANLTPPPTPSIGGAYQRNDRGGDYDHYAPQILSAAERSSTPVDRHYVSVGFRCARTP